MTMRRHILLGCIFEFCFAHFHARYYEIDVFDHIAHHTFMLGSQTIEMLYGMLSNRSA